MRKCRSASLVSLLLVLGAAQVRAQVPDSEPPVPPDTAAAVEPPAKQPHTAPPPAAATTPEPEPVLPWPQPEPAPGEPTTYPSEPAPELGPEPPPTPPAAPNEPTASEPPPSAAGTGMPRQVSIAALAGVGVTFDRTISGVNPLGFGFGLRGDYRFKQDFTLGARIVYFVGGSSELPTGSVDMHTWLVALEGSYAFDLNPILIKPGLLLGLAVRSTRGLPATTDAITLVAGSVSHSAVGMYVSPGVNVVVPLSLISPDLGTWFVGGDLRLDLVFGNQVSSNLQVLGQVGLNF
jgi:hypothetical protein